MGLITGLSALIKGGALGGVGTAVKGVAEAFIPNTEVQYASENNPDAGAMAQFATEFTHGQKGLWDRFFDGLNRLPRPLMVLSVFGLLIYTPIDPLRMAEVFTAWALIPTGLWAVAGIIVTFYFGGRAQIKTQEFQTELASVATRAPVVIEQIKQLRELRHDTPGVAFDDDPGIALELATVSTGNPAIDEGLGKK